MADEPVNSIEWYKQHLHSDNDDLGYNDLYEPWRNIIVRIKKATVNLIFVLRPSPLEKRS